MLLVVKYYLFFSKFLVLFDLDLCKDCKLLVVFGIILNILFL